MVQTLCHESMKRGHKTVKKSLQAQRSIGPIASHEKRPKTEGTRAFQTVQLHNNHWCGCRLRAYTNHEWVASRRTMNYIWINKFSYMRAPWYWRKRWHICWIEQQWHNPFQASNIGIWISIIDPNGLIPLEVYNGNYWAHKLYSRKKKHYLDSKVKL